MPISVVKPVVQNAYKRCRSGKCIQGHIPMHAIFTVFIYFFIPVLSRPFSLLGLQTKTRRSSNSSTAQWFKSCHPETFMSSAVNIFVHTIHKNALRKKWHVLVRLDRFPWFNHHSIALVLLYNMSLEPSFSIERFPSYTQLNIGAKITFQRMNHVDKLYL